MSYSPHVDADKRKMLDEVGVTNINDVFADIPESIYNPNLNLPPALSEQEALEMLKDFEELNLHPARSGNYFLGGGAYNHHIPSAVAAITSAPEFYTAYTPYQPEMSQGMLQAIFEYQSVIARITGLDASNASMYDGGTACYEACAMAVKQTKKTRILFDSSLNPHYRELLKSYGENVELDMVEIPYSKVASDSIDSISEKMDNSFAAIVVQNPDFFGRIVDYSKLAEVAHKNKALLIMVVNPVSLGILKTPAEMGADIAVGEGQPLGLSLNYGGPYLGFIASTKKLLRKMPGRIVGETVDSDGKRGYVLTLQAREQHIRREKATSNICSNQALCALSALVHTSLIGKKGFRQVSELCIQKANYAKNTLGAIDGAEIVFDGPHFNEFVLRISRPVEDLFAAMGRSCEPGIRLNRWYPELEDCILVAVTELNTKNDIDAYARRLRDWLCK